jgi:hypothetical protein
MWRYRTLFLIAALFIAASAVFYLLHYSIFQDPHHIFIFLLSDFAFLPLEVFLVVIVIERILARREKQAVLKKLNMVIGAFFSEVGNYLLNDMLDHFKEKDEMRKTFAVNQHWTHNDFAKAASYAISMDQQPDYRDINFVTLKQFMIQKRTFLLGLLENPNLLEHDRFTDLLWATFHLTEELEARRSFNDLPESDIKHIALDLQRVYRHLTTEWLLYVEHLKIQYPYLFSLVVRTQPFQESPSPVVL